MDEVATLLRRHVARLRQIGVTGDIMIFPSFQSSDDPKRCFGRWSLYVDDKLISHKNDWPAVEAEVKRILSGDRKSLVEDPKRKGRR